MKSTSKAIVLLSGGLDSSFNFLRAQEEMEVTAAITFDYGQRAAKKEMERAQAQCSFFKVKHFVVDVKWFREFTQTSLVNVATALPRGDEVNIESLSHSEKTAARVWVPNRNGIFLNIAAGFAEGLGCQWVIPGFNYEEAATFPDNSEPFMKALDQSFWFSTANHVKVFCFSVHLDKFEILKEGLKRGLRLEHLWPCYEAFDEWCGECESCLRFNRALQAVKERQGEA